MADDTPCSRILIAALMVPAQSTTFWVAGSVADDAPTAEIAAMTALMANETAGLMLSIDRSPVEEVAFSRATSAKPLKHFPRGSIVEHEVLIS